MTAPTFTPVPAFPIVVLAHRKGECAVLTPNGAFTGITLRAALEQKVAA